LEQKSESMAGYFEAKSDDEKLKSALNSRYTK